MRNPHCLGRALLAAMVLAMPAPATAAIVQGVSVSFTDPTGTRIFFDDDRTSDAVGPITDTAFAQINGTFGQAVAAIGPAGDLGTRGDILQAGFARTAIASTNSFIPNLNVANDTSNARARFIIDGGLLSFVAGIGSSMTFSLRVAAHRFEQDGSLIPNTPVFGSAVELVMTPANSSDPEITFFGDDIGATRGRSPFQVVIPRSFQTYDIGPVPRGGHVDLIYELSLETDVVDFSEIVAWEFSDPLSVGGPTGFITVEFFGEALATVPEPASLPLAMLGLAGVGLFIRGRSPRPGAKACACRAQAERGVGA